MSRRRFLRSTGGLLDRGCAELLGQSEHALDAADSDLTLATMEGMTEAADMRAGLLGSPQQLMDAQGSSWGTVLFLDAINRAIHRLCPRGWESLQNFVLAFVLRATSDDSQIKDLTGL